MGRIDDKKSVFTEIGALTSVKDNFNIPDPTSSLSSINNSKEAMPFMLDMLTVLIGSQALQQATGELMTSFVRNVEPDLKSELKTTTIQYNSDQNLPTGFAAGYTISAKDVDPYGKLKTDPATQTGSILYNDNINDFDVKSYQAIKNPGTDVTFNNIIINYNESTDKFTYKPVSASQTIGNFTSDYVDGLTVINEKEFISNTLNNIFGSVTSQQNKTVSQIYEEEKFNKMLQKLIDGDENIEISDDELRQLLVDAENKQKGIQIVDVGCSVLETDVSIEDIKTLIENTTGSTDPLNVGNQYAALISNSVSGSRATRNAQAIKDGFFKRIINSIVQSLLAAITAPPQIRVLFAITSAFKNNDVISLSNPTDDLLTKRKQANCLSKTAQKTINEFVFNMVKKQLLALIIPVSKIILKEKINQYLNILKSLTGFSS